MSLEGAAELDDLDEVVRRADPDRWLASRFITVPEARADVIALYALEHELARIERVVREPLMAEIRLTWWVEAIDEIFAGKPPRRHPVVLALARAISRRGLPQPLFEQLLEARFAMPFDAAASENALMRMAATALGAPSAAADSAARAWADQDSGALGSANRDLKDLPAAAFPAVAYATLVRAARAGALERRLRLTWAVLRGRL